jgi:hypothetical protein
VSHGEVCVGGKNDVGLDDWNGKVSLGTRTTRILRLTVTVTGMVSEENTVSEDGEKEYKRTDTERCWIPLIKGENRVRRYATRYRTPVSQHPQTYTLILT